MDDSQIEEEEEQQQQQKEEEEEDGQLFKTITALVWAVLYCVIVIR